MEAQSLGLKGLQLCVEDVSKVVSRAWCLQRGGLDGCHVVKRNGGILPAMQLCPEEFQAQDGGDNLHLVHGVTCGRVEVKRQDLGHRGTWWVQHCGHPDASINV